MEAMSRSDRYRASDRSLDSKNVMKPRESELYCLRCSVSLPGGSRSGRDGCIGSRSADMQLGNKPVTHNQLSVPAHTDRPGSTERQRRPLSVQSVALETTS